jgi:hypothetical protein
MPEDSKAAEQYRQAWARFGAVARRVYQSYQATPELLPEIYTRFETVLPRWRPPEIGDGLGFDQSDEFQEKYRKAAAAIDEFGDTMLSSFPLVSGVAVSLRYAGGEILPEPCVTFFVEKKLPESAGEPAIPRSIAGVPTDVVEAGRPVLQTSGAGHIRGQRIRPAQPGTSISHIRVTAGTFGCLVEDEKRQYILSCAHVLSDAAGAAGEAIVQPGTHYGGAAPKDQVARLTKTVPLSNGVCIADAGIAEVDDPSGVTADIRGLGKPVGTRSLTGLGVNVQKSGDFTGVTHGIVTGLKGTITLPINGMTVTFQDAIITSGMSGPGDSGSLLMDNRNQAIGLLFGGLQHESSWVVSWYNPIDVVLGKLGVTLVT